MALAEVAHESAIELLASGGSFVCKVLQGGAQGDLLAALKRDFAAVRHVKPPASRADSSEVYLVAQGFRTR
jgi:23S rRNA (uridine2552-2'-O)-methyltransferase